jgi:hypothetical protein
MERGYIGITDLYPARPVALSWQDSRDGVDVCCGRVVMAGEDQQCP